MVLPEYIAGAIFRRDLAEGGLSKTVPACDIQLPEARQRLGFVSIRFSNKCQGL